MVIPVQLIFSFYGKGYFIKKNRAETGKKPFSSVQYKKGVPHIIQYRKLHLEVIKIAS